MVLDSGDQGDIRGRLKAIGDNPSDWFRVSAIAEYVFCPRAGLLTHESRIEDRGEDGQTYDLLPRYEEEAIHEALKTRVAQLISLLLLFFGITFIAVFFAPVSWRPVSDLIGFVTLVLISYVCIVVTRNLVVLLWRYDQARGAATREPDPDSTEIQAVDWWELLASKFAPTHDPEFEDEEFQLRGRPLRVLKRGDVTIPVFRARSQRTEPKPQQIVRIMGYCVLLELTYGHVPYGVILFGKSYKGVAVPNIKRYRRQFYDAFVATRKMIKASNETDGEDLQPGVPRDREKCSGCHLGCPRKLSRIKPTYRYDEELDAYIVSDNYRQSFHSDCGDRFGWLPPHKDSKRLGLRG